MAGTVSTAAGGPQASRQPLRNTGTRPAGPQARDGNRGGAEQQSRQKRQHQSQAAA